VNIVDQIIDSLYDEPDSWTFETSGYTVDRGIFNNEIGVKIMVDSYHDMNSAINHRKIKIPMSMFEKWKFKRALRDWKRSIKPKKVVDKTDETK